MRTVTTGGLSLAALATAAAPVRGVSSANASVGATIVSAAGMTLLRRRGAKGRR